jgi:DNA-binding LacI/PurR family transcriptional regulator
MKKTARPTIFDLVDYTGISRGTISRAFNNQEGIKAATKEKILRAAREIGYIPHNGARMMKLGRTSRWAILIPHLHNPYYAELVEALNQEAGALGITLLVGISNNDKNREAEMILQWTAGETDGLILDQSHYHDNPAMFQQLKARGIAMVFLHGNPIPDFDFVRYELFESVGRLLNHYRALGHTRIGYAAQNFSGCRKTGRFRAYAKHAVAEGEKPDESLIHFGEDGAEGGVQAFRKWAALPDPPTAVFCADDIIACGVMHAARVAGWSIPKDLSIAGVDDIAEGVRAGLTTVRTSRVQTAKAICELMELRREAFDRNTEVRSIPAELILRDSIARPRQHPPKK